MKRFAQGYEFFARIVLFILVTHSAMIVHTLIGAVLLGLFPSLSACMGVGRKWILDSQDRSWTITRTWRTFHELWKQEFRAANYFGVLQSTVLVPLAWEYWFVQHNDLGICGVVVSAILAVTIVLASLSCIYSWALFTHFNESPLWLIRTSVIMVIARPLCSLMVVAILVATIFIYHQWPGLVIACGLAAPFFGTMLIIYSWGRIPGLDVQTMEPCKKRKQGRHRNRKSERTAQE